MADVVVVGAGVGGMAAAIRLRAAGHHVVVLERADRLGGKLAVERAKGFTWETGPSLLTLPQVFDDLLALAGTSLAERAQPVRLDPSFRYHFADGSTLETRDDPAATAVAVERFSPGSGPAWAAHLARGRQVWEVAERTFFAGPIERPLALARRMRSPRDLLAVDPLATLHQRAAATFTDPRLVQWADRYATYTGSSPYRVPATLGCIPAIEADFGAWYLRGGLGTLAEALAEAMDRLGVEVHLGADVERVTTAGGGGRRGRVTGVALAGGERVAADVVVADVDAAHLYADLVPDRQAARRVTRAGRSSSAFVLLLGVRGRTDGLAHHTVSFSADYRAEFAAIHGPGGRRRPPADPTIYVCASSRTDPSQAPAGHENWFVLVNVAPDADAPVWDDGGAGYGDRVLTVLARRGFDLTGRIVHRQAITPRHIARRDRAVGGAIYGTSSHGRRAAFARPPNRGPRPGLYLVGGTSHPGGGLPLVALSGRIVADMVARDVGPAPAA